MRLNVNGADVEVDDRFAASPLLWVLRDVLGMHGTKYGCGIGYCAACTVLIDGRNTKSCQTPAGQAVGKAVTTVEGASGPVVDAVRDAWHPVMEMHSVPQIDVLLIESGEPPTGVGEVSVPPAAPALTNAIFALTGTRIRRLPLAGRSRSTNDGDHREGRPVLGYRPVL